MKKKGRKKKISKTTIIASIVGGIIGFLIAVFGHRINMIEGFISPPIYIIVLIMVLTFILSVTLHEFGHAISFLINGIKMRAIIFVNFLLIKEDGGWKFKIIRNSSLGGITVPEITNIKDEEEFLKVQKGFANALIAGPIASIVSWIALTIIGVIIIRLTRNVYINSVIIVFLISLGLITILLLISSFLKNDMVIGDFPAYKTSKSDKYFVAMQLYNYGYFSSDPEKAREENIYLRQFIIKELQEKYENRDTHWYTLSMIDTILLEYLAGFLKELPMVVEDYINYILESPDILLDLRETQEKEIMYFHLIMYLYKDEKTKDRALDLYEKIKRSIKPNTPKRKYLFKQIDQLLGLADNRKFLMEKKNIINTDMQFIYKHFPGFFIDEIKINKLINEEFFTT